MRKVSCSSVLAFGCILSLPVLAAEPIQFLKAETRGDFLSVGFKFNQVMKPQDFSDTIKEAANNPLIVSALKQFGDSGAWAASALSINAGQTSGGGEEERYYRVDFPAGYKFCRIQMNTVSLVPIDGKRASIIAAVPHIDYLDISAWTPKRKPHEGNSWVEADFYTLLVKEGSREDFINKGFCKEPKVLVNCRGNGGGDDGRGACGTHEL